MAVRRKVPAGYLSGAQVPPDVQQALATCNHRIVQDIAERFARYGSISPKQAQLVLKLAGEQEARAIQRQALAAQGVRVPAGKRVVVEGTIRSFKDKEWGLHFVVEAAAGWKVWSKVPAAIRRDACVGDLVRFVADVIESDNDATFGFARRPTKAVILPSPGRAVADLVTALADYAGAWYARENATATAAVGCLRAIAAYGCPEARAVAGIARELYARWLGTNHGCCPNAGYDNGKCSGGYIRWYSSDYPCGYCGETDTKVRICRQRAALRLPGAVQA